MKFKDPLLIVLVSLIPASLLALNLHDLYALYSVKNDYAFSSEFFAPFSIYKSKSAYLFYTILFSLVLVLSIVLATMKRWKTFVILLIVDILFLIYPMITNE